MEIKEISTAALKEKIEADEELYLIDVREDEEVAEGMIPQAVHIRMGIFLKKWTPLIKTKSTYLSAAQECAA